MTGGPAPSAADAGSGQPAPGPGAGLGGRLRRRLGRTLDTMEANLRHNTGLLARPRVEALAVAGLLAVGLLLRLGLAAAARDVTHGHNDAWIYFNYVWGEWLGGNVFPDAHRGSGWMLLLWVVLRGFGFEGGEWVPKNGEATGDAAQAIVVAHTLSAVLSAGILAATYLLSRQLVGPRARIAVLALLCFDPYLLFTSTSALSEPPYTVLFVLAAACVLAARRRPAWLLVAAALMAGAHMLRINGLVMAIMFLAFAALVVPGRGRSAKPDTEDGAAPRPLPGKTHAARVRPAWLGAGAKGAGGAKPAWLGAAVVTFLVVASPYLLWRAEHLPGPFDYGTNQRFWADELWDTGSPLGNTTDPYWSTYDAKTGGERETMGDYLADHTWRDAVGRLFLSIQYQVFDLLGVGKWPAGQVEGGVWPGSPPDGSALTPLAVVLLALAAFHLRGRQWAFVPLALAFTFATFVWIYPLVRSVRYFAPLIPLLVLAGVAGYAQVAPRLRRPMMVAAGTLAAHLLLYAAPPVVHALPDAVGLLGNGQAATVAALGAACWFALALAPLARGRRAPADLPSASRAGA